MLMSYNKESNVIVKNLIKISPVYEYIKTLDSDEYKFKINI